MAAALVTACSRPLANYHPSVWGDRFLHNTPKSTDTEAREKQVVEELKEVVKRELKEALNDYTLQLKMVDAIQRLGIEYHFEEEIEEALQNVLEQFDDYCKNNNEMSFKWGIFDKYKDNEDGFRVPDSEKVVAVLEFFEAAHVRIHGEDALDNAVVFTRNYLESILPSLSNPVAEQVRHALYGYSNRRGLPRVEARKYISIYEQYASHHQRLLKLAKWWKGLEVPTKLSYARDRLVENYFWDSGVYFEPQYARARIILTKVQCLISVTDDTFDAYATFEELQLFTDAIQRWSISCLDQLPDNMKIIYKALLEVFEEIEKEMIKQGTLYRLNYGIKAFKLIVGAYFDEIKWREKKYIPKTQEYMQVATKSAGYITLAIISFLGMEDNVATREAFEWVFSQPDILRAANVICRLTDDIMGHEFEKKRKHIPSAVECYAEEHKVSKGEANSELSNRIEAAWKDMNEAFLRPTKFPTPLLYRILNFARAIEVIYSKGDWYTHVGPELQSIIKQLYIDPVP
ncbi:hypothetical protein ACS0TY_019190 [Phlomoides rotata]